MSPFLYPFDRYNLDSFSLGSLSGQTLKYLCPQIRMQPLFWSCPEFSSRDKRAAVTMAQMLPTHPHYCPQGPCSASETGQWLLFGTASHTDISNPAGSAKAGAYHWCRALSLSYPTVWGSSSALFAGRGCARLRKENKSSSQGSSHSRAFPAISNILPVLFAPAARTEEARPPCREHLSHLTGACHSLHSSRDLPAHLDFLTLHVPLNPTRAEVLYRTRKNRSTLLVWWIHPPK